MTTPHPTVALDRNGLEVLDLATCMTLAGSVAVARLAVNGPGSPVVMPITHVVLDDAIAFRTASGSKLDAAIMEALVSVEVDDWDLATRTGWSVLVEGTASPVLDDALLEQLAPIAQEPWIKPGREMTWVIVRPVAVSGRRILPAQ